MLDSARVRPLKTNVFCSKMQNPTLAVFGCCFSYRKTNDLREILISTEIIIIRNIIFLYLLIWVFFDFWENTYVFLLEKQTKKLLVLDSAFLIKKRLFYGSGALQNPTPAESFKNKWKNDFSFVVFRIY